MEEYQEGQILRYDGAHSEDSFGFLTAAILDLKDFAEFAISAQEFETAWNTGKATNR